MGIFLLGVAVGIIIGLLICEVILDEYLNLTKGE